MAQDAMVNEGKLYVMPKVSVIIQEGNMPSRSYGYSYAQSITKERRSPFSFITSLTTAIVGFFLIIAMFAIPVSVASVVLINTMSSQGIITLRTQEVPSDGTQRYTNPERIPPVVPANR